MENVAEQMRAKAQAKDDLIIVQVDAADRIYADYDRFIQVMVNLTQNAIQFTKNGTITLSSFPDGDQQVIQVKDTGIGIEKKDITSIWERFYKVDVSRKNTKFGESGIGLAVVQSLVMNHKGTVERGKQSRRGNDFHDYIANENCT